MRTDRSKTEAEKKAASERQKGHWRRCEAWGRILQVDKMKVNDHWSCCLKDALGTRAQAPNITRNDVSKVKRAFADCLWAKAKREQELLEHRTREQTHIRSPRRPKTSDEEEIPELDQRIKIMLWAIRTCGGVENAQDALDRAIRSLEDE